MATHVDDSPGRNLPIDVHALHASLAFHFLLIAGSSGRSGDIDI